MGPKRRQRQDKNTRCGKLLSKCSQLRKHKFFLLLWKNYILQKRHYYQTLFEVLLPLLFPVLIVMLRISTPIYEYESKSFPEFNPKDHRNTFVHKWNYLLYAPNTPEVEKLMEKVGKQFKALSNPIFALDDPVINNTRPWEGESDHEEPPNITYDFKGYKDADSLIQSYQGNAEIAKGSLGAVIFTSDLSNDEEISYQIRFPLTDKGSEWTTNMQHPNIRTPEPQLWTHYRIGSIESGYRKNGFLFLQSVIDTAIIWTRATRNMSGYRVTLNRFPYPKYKTDSCLRDLQEAVLPLSMVLSYCYSVAAISKSIVLERERRLKETMKMMGLPGWLHWTAWFTKSFILLLIFATTITILFKVKLPVKLVRHGVQSNVTMGVFENTTGSLLFVFLIAYLFTVITFGFLIASLSSKSSSAAISSSISFFLSFAPYMPILHNYNIMSRGAKLFSSLLSNTAMGFGCYILTARERFQDGTQWNNWNQGAFPDDNISLKSIVWMLILDGLLYLLVAIYVEAVFPGEYGAPLPWNYPFLRSYWLGKKIPFRLRQSRRVVPEDSFSDHASYIETDPEGFRAGIKLVSLSREFGNTVAVDGLKLNFYENQVTALLGHNGAGKTTTMSVITGLYPPSSGTAIVNGFDVRTDIPSIHKSLGVCPQQSVLFDELTVEEHLQFFCLLKGFDKSLQPEIDKMLNNLKLVEMRTSTARMLSGGTRRKLAVAIALIGGSKVVLLDEPTTGMDPGSRRSTWDLISREKQGRTIVLCTHFMDEAELFGDKIVILAHGKVACSGTPHFLKRKFGGGYRLVMIKESDCKVKLITQLLQKHIPKATVERNIGSELSFSLPDGKVALFPTVFAELEKRKDELGIASYGCSVVKMEDVFIRADEEIEKKIQEAAGLRLSHAVTDQPQQAKKSLAATQVLASRSKSKKSFREQAILLSNMSVADVSLDPSHVTSTGEQEPEKVERANPPRNSGIMLLVQRLRAMVVKKWLYAAGNRTYYISYGIMPCIVLIFMGPILTFNVTDTLFNDRTPIPLDLRDYHDSSTLTHCDFPQRPKICTDFEVLVESQQSKLIGTEVSKHIADYIITRSLERGLVSQINFYFIVGLETTEEKRSGQQLDLGYTLFDSSEEVDNTGNNTGQEKKTILKLKGLFNNQPYHAAPIALNLISNSLLRNLGENDQLKLTTYNYPLPVRSKHEIDHEDEGVGVGQDIGLPLNMNFIMSFVAAGFIIFPIKERESKFKHIQFVSGVRYPIFWMGSLMFDMAYYIVICILMTFVPIIFPIEALGSAVAIWAFFLLLVMYGWAVIPMTYLFSFMFHVPPTGYIIVVFIYIISGFVCMVIALLGYFQYGLVNWSIQLLVPNYSLLVGLFQISRIHDSKRLCPTCDLPLLSYGVDTTGIGKYLFFLFLSGFASCGLVFVIESKVLQRFNCYFWHTLGKDAWNYGVGGELVDADVAAENDRIRSSSFEAAEFKELLEEETMVLFDLSKFYGNFLALDKICLGIQPGECFGLLGVNGGGKTTLFKMLTRDLPISHGDAFIDGKSIKTLKIDPIGAVGYCPQADAFMPELTGAQTLRLFARIRGVYEPEIEGIINELAEDLYLTEFMKLPCRTYSGSHQRKLSAATAIIGRPPIIFLDEPTAGMDPVIRRHLWDTIGKLRETGTSVVLATHNMDDCEALCNRLAILVQGKFRCLGSAQHLKSTYGDGYTLIAQTMLVPGEQPKWTTKKTFISGKTKIQENGEEEPEPWEASLQPLRDCIENTFPNCQLKDMHPSYVHYNIPLKGASTWSEMFKKMEEVKTRFNLESYSIGQTSLEEVFLGFARGQWSRAEVE